MERTIEQITREWKARDAEIEHYGDKPNMLRGKNGLINDWYRDVGILLHELKLVPEKPYS